MKKTKFSQRIIVGLLAVLMIFAAAGCTGTESVVQDNTSLELQYSDSFSVSYLDDGVKLLTDGDGREIILALDGQEVPEEYSDATIITSLDNGVMIASTTQACMLRGIDELDSITAVTSDTDTWTIEEVAEGLEDGSITYVGDNTAVDYEMIQELDPSVVFVYSGDYGLQDMMAKFDELGIPYVVANEYLEETVQGRMEWMEFYAAFFDKEDDAVATLDEKYASIDETVAAAEEAESPNVAWGMVYDGTAYVTTTGSYVTEMIEMAGGNNVLGDYDESVSTMTLEEYYVAIEDVDVLMYSSLVAYTPDIATITAQAPVLEDVQVIQDGNVYALAACYWQSVDKMDEIVAELYDIFHDEVDGDLTYFVKLD